MNVGILYPRSKAHPSITQDFMDGIKACMGPQPNGINLVTESIGYAGSEKEVYEKAEKLLLIDEVDVLVAYIGEKVLEILHPLLQSSGKLLLVVHPGANYPHSWIPQPNMIQLTLQDAFLCWLSGRDAGKHDPGDAIMASTFYDCGYLHLATMVNGYTEQGGQIAFNYVNRQSYDQNFHIDELEKFLVGHQGHHNLLAVFDALPASLFYDKLNGTEQATALDLYVSPMMLQPDALVNSSKGFKFSLNGYTPWLPGASDAGNKDFCDAFRLKSKREPGLFALLGWETGMILQQVAANAAAGFDDGAAIAAALQKKPFRGPRGELQLDPATNYFTTGFVKCSMGSGTGNMTTTSVPFPSADWATYIQLPTDGSDSGWTNTYLCY